MAEETSDKTLKLEICALDRAGLKAEVKEVSVPTTLGTITVLPGHAPLLITLDIGVMTANYANGERHVFAINGGVLKILSDEFLVLTDTVEMDAEIDIERAELARKRAEERIKETADQRDEARTEAALRRAAARIRAHSLGTGSINER